MSIPFGRLLFLYMGSSSFEDDFRYYRDVLGAKLRWSFERFGAKVAAFEVGEGPLLLLADHLPAPSCMPLFEVNNLQNTISVLKGKGWKENKQVEVPNGPCVVFQDPSGNHMGLLQNTRPFAMEEGYKDTTNPYRLHIE